MMGLDDRRIRLALATAATFVVLILSWWAFVRLNDIAPSVLPPPSSVFDALWLGWIDGALYPHLRATLTASLVGLTVGGLTGFLLGVAFAEISLLDRAFMPIVTIVQSIPKIAIAPLLIVYVGYDLGSKIATVGVLCLFPIILAAYYGIRSAPRDLVDVYRTLGAPWWKIFLRVKLPSAAGALFAGLQISVVLAISGAVVSEFIAARAGLGYVINSRMGQLDVSMMFACIVSLAVIGAVANALVLLTRKKVAFWLERGNP